LIRARAIEAREGARHQARPQTEIDRSPETRGDPPPRPDGEPAREIARPYNVSHSTISRLTLQYHHQ